MVSINYASREVACKIVYYGPGLSGKTTNLQYVHAKVPQKTRGDLISLATDSDRTLYFDFLPINIGTINGLTTKFQLYTVPGQVFYNATRKLVLRGVDGIVFVADSQRAKREENIESLHNLKENLLEYGYDIESMPVVLQYNKSDLPDVMDVEELQADLNWNNVPYFHASAMQGVGVFDTLKTITKLVLATAQKSQTTSSDQAVTQHSISQSTVAEPSTVQAPVMEAVTAETIIAQPELPPGVIQVAATATEQTEQERKVDVPAEVMEEVLVTTDDSTKVETGRKHESMCVTEIEKKLTMVEENHPAPTTSAVKDPIDTEISGSEYADTFEVPKVIAMQKSLKVKKKKKKFWLFRLFSWKRN